MECFKNGILNECDEVCGKKKSRRNRGDTWLWNEEVKDTIRRKKEVNMELCRNWNKEINCAHHEKNAKKMVAKAIKRETQKTMSSVDRDSDRMLRLIRSIKRDDRDVVGRGCIKGRNGKLHFS